MKKAIFIYFICVSIIFTLPFLWIHKDEINEESVEKIKVLITKTGEIKEMPLEEYIIGVLIGEMPVDFELEALKAQAVVARTYTLYKMKNKDTSHKEADVCDNIWHCQAYKTKDYAFASWDDKEENEKWNKAKLAVESTKNEVIKYNGNLIQAFFHSHSGGKTEDVKNIWGKHEIEYLKSVNGMEEKNILEEKFFDWKNVKEKLGQYIAGDKINNIKILERDESQRVLTCKIENNIFEGTEIRKIFGLKSTNFEIEQDDRGVSFKTKGYGHGIGMSQYGANNMAKQGANYKEIIKHYYSNVDIVKE